MYSDPMCPRIPSSQSLQFGASYSSNHKAHSQGMTNQTGSQRPWRGDGWPRREPRDKCPLVTHGKGREECSRERDQTDESLVLGPRGADGLGMLGMLGRNSEMGQAVGPQSGGLKWLQESSFSLRHTEAKLGVSCSIEG